MKTKENLVRYETRSRLGSVSLQYLPEFEIKKEDLRMFPEPLIADVMRVLDGSGLPPGYGE